KSGRIRREPHKKRPSTARQTASLFPDGRHRRLIVLLLGLEVSLRMFAGGADLRSFGRLADVAAVAALPPDFAVALEEIAVREAAQQLEVALLVLGLDRRNHLERCGDLGES